MKKLLLTLLGASAMLPAFAQDFQYTYEGKTLTYTVISTERKTCKTKEGTVASYGVNPGNRVSGKVILPDMVEYNGETYTLVSIGDSGFRTCGITEIVFPSNLTSIGEHAFFKCTGLQSVIIPDSVTYIHRGAFSECSGLQSVIIPDSVPDIDDYAFSGCSGLQSVTIPNSVTVIGYSAFSGCSSLQSVTIGNSVRSIGSAAFSGCSSLTEINVDRETPPSITTYSSWDSSTYDTACLKIPAEATFAYLSSGWKKFKNMKCGEYPLSLFSDDVLEYRLLHDAENPVAYVVEGDYSDLTEITIPERITDTSDPSNPIRYYVTGIAPNAFSNLENLKTVTFNRRSVIATIGEYAFKGCTGLTSITLPETVTSIGSNAFYNCTGLTKAEFASIEAMCGINFRSGSANPLYYAKNLWVAGENITELIIPASVETIGNYAFSGGSTLTSVSLPETVTSIGSSAFGDCTGLTKAEFASIEAMCGIEYGGDSANPLWYAKNLWVAGENITELIIPASVETIGNYAFSGGSKLTSVTIPNSVTSIGEYAFSRCSGLQSVTIPDHVTSIGDGAFRDCDGLQSVIIPNYVTSIGKNAFRDCDGLQSVIIPNSVTSIGGFAFGYCSGLQSVTIPNSVTSIGGYAFSRCRGLQSVIIGNSVRTIGSAAFYGCSSLTSVIIPNSVTSIGESAFSDCKNLESVTIGNSLETIDEIIFGVENNRDGTIDEYSENVKSLIFADGSNPIGLNGEFRWNLETLYLGRQIDHAFNSISSLTVGNLVETIKSSQFKDFTNLTSVTLGSGLKSIEDQAFSGCTGLTEIVIPTAVETIGESAFAGCSNLAKIVMGSEVKTIADNAFNGTKATDVYITAQTPPTAPNTTFSNYSGKLWLQDPGDDSVIDAYYDAYTCWDRFDSYAMIKAETIEVTEPVIAEGQSTFQLSATITPSNVTLDDVLWSSDAPEIATVDNNGLVTLQPLKEETQTRAPGSRTCKITASTLYANGPIAEVTIVNNVVTGIEVIAADAQKANGGIDFNEQLEVFDLNGVRVSNSMDYLPKGIYIVRQGANVKKVMK